MDQYLINRSETCYIPAHVIAVTKEEARDLFFLLN